MDDLSLISIQSSQTNNSLFSIVDKLPLNPKQTKRPSNRGLKETQTFKPPMSQRNKARTSCFNQLSHNTKSINTINGDLFLENHFVLVIVMITLINIIEQFICVCAE